jgi:hypothetical protein
MSLALEEVRSRYLAALIHHEQAESLLADLNRENHPNPLLTAYRAAVLAVTAKHTGNPFRKLDYVRQSEQAFRKAVTQDSENVEIRYLRFSIQHHLPAFLGMSRDLERDAQVIVQRMSHFEGTARMKAAIIRFMIESGRCEESQVEQLKMGLTDT